jgi:hypothetical protein
VARPFKRPVRRSPKSDPQQYRVYRMETEAIGACSVYRLSKPAVRTMIKAVCRSYGVPKPRVYFQNLGRTTAEWREHPLGMDGPSTIAFNTVKGTARDALTVTHELAHHIHYWLGNGAVDQESHGPEFVACHMSILDHRRMIPVTGMRAICKRYKIRFKDPGDAISLPRLVRIVKKRK